MPDPNPGDIVSCEPAQSKRTWTLHKSHFVSKFQGKMPETTPIKHQALTLTVRTPQCGHIVWGIIIEKKITTIIIIVIITITITIMTIVKIIVVIIIIIAINKDLINPPNLQSKQVSSTDPWRFHHCPTRWPRC